MKRIFALLALMAAPVLAQSPVIGGAVQYDFINPPSGSCAGAPPLHVYFPTGVIYSCDNGTWTAQGGGGGGGFPITLGSTTINSGSTTTAVSGLAVNGVTLSAAGANTSFLNQTGGYSVPVGSGLSGGTANLIPMWTASNAIGNTSPQLDVSTNANGLTFGGSAGYYGKSYNSTDTVNNAAITFAPGSGGVSTCPAAGAGSSFLCVNASDGISYSNNGGAYSPLLNAATGLASTSYNAGSGGVTSNTLVMGDGAGNVIPFVNSTTSSTNYGLYVGVATQTATSGNPTIIANSSGQLASCQFDGTPVVGDTVIGSVTTPGDCHDAAITGTYVTPYMPVVGWTQSVSGTVGTVRLAGLGVWGSGNIVVSNKTANQSLYGPLTTPQINASQVGTVWDVDGFVSAASYYYTGIGVAQTVWSNTQTYGQCSAVSYSGGNYLSVVYRTTATPSFASSVWYPVPNANTPTALDCAYYTAAASIVTSGTGTITTVNTGTLVQLGVATYNTCIGLMGPTVTTPGWWGVSIKGAATGPSKINQTCTITNPVLEQPPSTANYDLARIDWEDFAVYANENAPAVVGLYGALKSIVKNLDLYDAALGNDHYMEIGQSGNMGWVYELTMQNVTLGANYGGCNGVQLSTSVTGGVPTVTVVAGGTGCNVNWAPTPAIINAGGGSCGSAGNHTVTYSGGAVTGFTTTATGCAANAYATLYGGPNVSYGFKFTNMSDSHDIGDLVCGGIGSQDCVYVSNVTSFNTFHKIHPIGSFDGVQNNSSRNDYFATQIDSVVRRGFDLQGNFGVVNIYGSMFEWANPLEELGAGDYFIGGTTSPPSNEMYAINIYGDMCGSSNTPTGYYHFGESNGIIDSSSIGATQTLHVHETTYCNQSGSSPALAPDYVGLQYNWSPGAWGNVFRWNMNPTAGGTPQLLLDNPLTTSGANQGVYDFYWNNPIAATSSLNPKSPIGGWCSPYWNGTATTPLCVQAQLSYGSGTGGLATLAFTYNGTLPANGAQYTFDNPVILPTGSTAITQTGGDSTTKVATDAFVANAVAGAGGAPNIPGWLLYYGSGADGAASITSTQALSGIKYYSTFSCSGTTTITAAANQPMIIRATTSITIGASCTLTSIGTTNNGDMGGSGGGGGGGTGAGTAGSKTYGYSNGSINTLLGGGSAGATSGGTGGNGLNNSTANEERSWIDGGLPVPEINALCGSPGGAGGSSGGAGGAAGGCIVLVAPVISLASGATFNVAGQAGGASTGNNIGAGGGGGGGVVIIRSPALTDSGATYTLSGGAAGSCGSFTGCGPGGTGGNGWSVKISN